MAGLMTQETDISKNHKKRRLLGAALTIELYLDLSSVTKDRNGQDS
jgi:hypothetical protein